MTSDKQEVQRGQVGIDESVSPRSRIVRYDE